LCANSPTSENDAHLVEESTSQREKVDKIKRDISRCIQLAENGKIDYATVHYRSWGSSSSVPVSEDDLITPHYDCYIVLQGSVIREPARMLAKYLRHYKNQLKACEVRPYYVDFALGVIYRCGDEEALRIFVSKDPPLVSINGEFFRPSPSVLYPLTMLLPPTVRDDMFAYMTLCWASRPHENLNGGESIIPDSLPDPIKSLWRK
jgi:hypothetical protein